MPSTFKRKYRPKKKAYRRTNITRRYKLGTNSRGMPFIKARALSFIVPPVMYTKFRYSQEILLNPTTSACVANSFAANGLYDPDLTGVGTQPRGFDQLCSAAGLYSSYLVLGSMITVKFVSQAADTTGITYVGISLRTSSTFATGVETQISDRYTKYKVLTGINSGTTRNVSNSLSVKKFLGLKDVQDEDACRAAYNANPTRLLYYQVWACPCNTGVVEPVSLVALVQIDYIVQLQNPVSLATS